MLTADHLFYQRLKREWLFKYKVWKNAISWIIFFYLVIPFGIVLGYKYIQLWKGNILLSNIGAPDIIVLMYIFMWVGGIRLFIELGDQLFIRQEEFWFNKLKRNGLVYSYIKTSITTVLFFLLVAPFFIIYFNVSTLTFFSIALFSILFRINIIYIKQLIEVYLNHWKKYITLFLVFIGGFFGYYYVIYTSSFILKVILIFILFAFIFLFHKIRMGIRWSFIDDCVNEQEERLKSIRLLLFSSSLIIGPVKKQKKGRKKPILFRHSNTFFINRTPNHVIIELHIKTVLRNKARLLYLFQILSISTYGILRFPFYLKFGLWIISIIFLSYFVKGYIVENKDSTILKLYKWNSLSVKNGDRVSILILSLPIVIITSFLLGTITISLLNGFIFVGVGVFLLFVLSKIVI